MSEIVKNGVVYEVGNKLVEWLCLWIQISKIMQADTNNIYQTMSILFGSTFSESPLAGEGPQRECSEI